MPSGESLRTQNLIALARDRFSADINDAEIKVLTDSAAGSDAPIANCVDPKPEVRAGLLQWMLTDADAAKLMDLKGMRARCITVIGMLDLSGQAVNVPIDCWNCDFKERIVLDSARTSAIYLTGGTLEKGLTADGAVVAGVLSIVAVVSRAALMLQRAMIKGGLDLSQTQLLDESAGLTAFECNVDGSVYLCRGFYCAGSIELYNAKIAGNLDCSGADIGSLILYNATIEKELIWYGIATPARAWLDLSCATVKRLRDDKASWPVKGRLILTGFQFDELVLHEKPTNVQLSGSLLPAEIPFSVDDRADWFLRQSDELAVRPQIWMYLRDLLSAIGDDEGARHTGFRLQRARAMKAPILFRPWQIAVAWLQESPGRILYTIVLVVAAGWAVFGYAASVGAMAPTEREAYEEWSAKKPIASAYPKLNPFMYALENALPLSKLGQDDKWAPDSNPSAGKERVSYTLLVWTRWFLILSGWIQATVLAAALSRRFKD